MNPQPSTLGSVDALSKKNVPRNFNSGCARGEGSDRRFFNSVSCLEKKTYCDVF